MFDVFRNQKFFVYPSCWNFWNQDQDQIYDIVYNKNNKMESMANSVEDRSYIFKLMVDDDIIGDDVSIARLPDSKYLFQRSHFSGNSENITYVGGGLFTFGLIGECFLYDNDKENIVLKIDCDLSTV